MKKKAQEVFNKKISRILILAFFDILSIVIASLLALWIRFDFQIIPAKYLHTVTYYLPLDCFIVVAIFAITGLYTSVWRYASIPELISVIGACVGSDLIIYAYKHIMLLPMLRSYWFIFPAILILFIILSRFSYRISREIVRKITARRRNNKIMIIGAGDAASILIDEMSHNETYSDCRIVCIIDDNKNKTGLRIHGIPIVGTRDNIKQVAKKYLVTEIIIAIPSASKKTISKILTECKKTECQVKIVPNAFYRFTDSPDNLNETIHPINYGAVKSVYEKEQITKVASIKSVFSSIESRKIVYLMLKRMFDIVISIVCCILTIFLLVIVKTIYLFNKDYAPILLLQERIGKNGKPFKMLKIRTMIPDAQKMLPRLLASNPKLKKEYEVNKKLKDDPRITKVGRVLRNLSLDEFPQFVNVLIGQMSIVGNRPYLVEEKKEMGDYFDMITESKPGIISYWAVNGRSDTSFNARLQLEEYYTMRRSLSFDLKIAVASIKVVFCHEGAK